MNNEEKKEQYAEHLAEKYEGYIPDFLTPHRKYMASSIDRSTSDLNSLLYMYVGVLAYNYTNNIYAPLLAMIIIHIMNFVIYYAEENTRYQQPLDKVMEERL